MIRLNDQLLHIKRRLSPVTTEEDAVRIHRHMGTDKLVRGDDGQWYCCVIVNDVEYEDKDITNVVEISQDFDEQGLS